MSFVVLDTDVASRSLKHELADPIAARLAGASIAITFVTLGELTKWTLIRSWGPQRLAALDRSSREWWCCPTARGLPGVGVSCKRTLSFAADHAQ